MGAGQVNVDSCTHVPRGQIACLQVTHQVTYDASHPACPEPLATGVSLDGPLLLHCRCASYTGYIGPKHARPPAAQSGSAAARTQALGVVATVGVWPVIDIERGQQRDVGQTHAADVDGMGAPDTDPLLEMKHACGEARRCAPEGYRADHEEIGICCPMKHSQSCRRGEHDRERPVVNRPPSGVSTSLLLLRPARAPVTTHVRPART